MRFLFVNHLYKKEAQTIPLILSVKDQYNSEALKFT